MRLFLLESYLKIRGAKFSDGCLEFAIESFRYAVEEDFCKVPSGFAGLMRDVGVRILLLLYRMVIGCYGPGAGTM